MSDLQSALLTIHRIPFVSLLIVCMSLFLYLLLLWCVSDMFQFSRQDPNEKETEENTLIFCCASVFSLCDDCNFNCSWLVRAFSCLREFSRSVVVPCWIWRRDWKCAFASINSTKNEKLREKQRFLLFSFRRFSSVIRHVFFVSVSWIESACSRSLHAEKSMDCFW